MRTSTATKIIEAAEPQKNKRVSFSIFACNSIVWVMTIHGAEERRIVKVNSESRSIVSTDLDHTITKHIYTLDNGETRTDGEVFATKDELKASI